MDLNSLLIWTVAAGCGMTLLQLPWQFRFWKSAVVPIALLLLLGICTYFVPAYAGLISGSLFILLMLVPAWGSAALNSLLQRRWYRLARLVSWLLAIVRPDRDARQLPQVIRAMQLAQSGQGDRAAELLDPIASGNHPLGRMALVLQTRFSGHWQTFLDWANIPENWSAVHSDPGLLDTFLQGLGETGQRDELYRHYERISATGQRLPATFSQLIRMKLAAFSGNDFIVSQFLNGPLRNFPDEVKKFWHATALQVAGWEPEATRELQRLLKSKDIAFSTTAKRRLDHPLPTLLEQPLADWQQARLHRISHGAEQDMMSSSIRFQRMRTCWGTWGIALVLVLVFLCEIPGGSENFENLERMGAMLIPPDPGGGQAWRIVAAAFLHFGPLHLIMNVLGLIVLGRRIEMEWGTLLLVLTYLLSAVSSIGLTPYFISQQPGVMETTVLVGASGGVMGLLGGLLIQSLAHLIQGRSRLAGREFLSLLVIVIVQLTFDANTPNVSSEAHLLGMSMGILCGVIWNVAWAIRQRWRGF